VLHTALNTAWQRELRTKTKNVPFCYYVADSSGLGDTKSHCRNESDVRDEGGRSYIIVEETIFWNLQSFGYANLKLLG
jgi:hypothetical protein